MILTPQVSQDKAMVLVARLTELCQEQVGQLKVLAGQQKAFDAIYRRAMAQERVKEVSYLAGKLDVLLVLEGDSDRRTHKASMLARVQERLQMLEQQQAQTEAADKARVIAVKVEEALIQERQRQVQVTPIAAEQSLPHLLYRQEMVRCGKAACKKCAEGKPRHGPYWYVFSHKDGKTTKSYVGKELPKNIKPEEHTIRTYTATGELETTGS